MEDILKKANTEFAIKNGLVEDTASYEEAKEAIRNPDYFAFRIEPSVEEIQEGVFLSSKTIELGGGNFCNVYDLYFKNEGDGSLVPKILTRQQPLYAHRLFVNSERKNFPDGMPLASINGPFFFLQDEILEKVPEEIVYNLNIVDGNVKGLPAVDRMALVAFKSGALEAMELKSTGIIMINNQDFSWVGGEPIAHSKVEILDEQNTKTDAVLFNSACCTIQYENPEDKTSLRKLRKDLNKTPIDSNKTDLVIKNVNGVLRVSDIKVGGGSDFFDGNFILQVPSIKATTIAIGDIVSPESVGGIKISEIESAITTGPDVNYFRDNTDHQINHDPSLGTFPPFDPNARYARSIMYKDPDDFVHMVVFDAVPRSKTMKGVTPKEAAEHLPVEVKWSVFLDGGQSSRITFVNADEIDSKGNQQYVRLHERYKTGQNSMNGEGDHQFLWTRKGRPLSSMVVLFRKNP